MAPAADPPVRVPAGGHPSAGRSPGPAPRLEPAPAPAAGPTAGPAGLDFGPVPLIAPPPRAAGAPGAAAGTAAAPAGRLGGGRGRLAVAAAGGGFLAGVLVTLAGFWAFGRGVPPGPATAAGGGPTLVAAGPDSASPPHPPARPPLPDGAGGPPERSPPTPVAADPRPTDPRPEVGPPKPPPTVAMSGSAEPKVTGPAKPPPPGEADPNPTPEVLARARNATALVEGRHGSGTGFLVRRGLLVTTAHLINGELLDDLRVRFVTVARPDPPALKPTLVTKDRRLDLAVLRVPADGDPLPLRLETAGLDAARVAVVGHSVGSAGVLKIGEVTTGDLKAAARLKGGQIFYELSVPAAAGNSGGPVLEATTGAVVGVATSGVPGETKTFCVPAPELAGLLGRVPDDRAQEARLGRAAAARHALDYLAARLPAAEANARLAMQLQYERLKKNSEQVTVEVEGKTYEFAKVMAEMKGEQARCVEAVAGLVRSDVERSPDVPAELRDLARDRVAACVAMRGLATSRTDSGARFLQLLDARKATSEKKAQAFAKEYDRFVRHLAADAASAAK